MGQGMPYFRWFPKDYAGDALVQAMTDDQDLIYRRLLDMSWQIGPLPCELEDLARLARFELERFKEAWQFPLTGCWHLNGNKKLINHRLEEERESTLDRSTKARYAVQCREQKRAKRLGIKKKKESSSDHRPISPRSSSCDLNAIHPYPYPYPDPDPKPDKEKENTDLSEARKAPEPSVAMVRSDVKKALWLDGALVVNKRWLADEMEDFYEEADRAIPEASKIRLDAKMYKRGFERLSNELLIHCEQRAVPASTSAKKRGFATRVSRHFKRMVMDQRCSKFPTQASRVDSQVQERLIRAQKLRKKEEGGLLNG